jgi:hypothetical protein
MRSATCSGWGNLCAIFSFEGNGVKKKRQQVALQAGANLVPNIAELTDDTIAGSSPIGSSSADCLLFMVGDGLDVDPALFAGVVWAARNRRVDWPFKCAVRSGKVIQSISMFF